MSTDRLHIYGDIYAAPVSKLPEKPPCPGDHLVGNHFELGIMQLGKLGASEASPGLDSPGNVSNLDYHSVANANRALLYHLRGPGLHCGDVGARKGEAVVRATGESHLSQANIK